MGRMDEKPEQNPYRAPQTISKHPPAPQPIYRRRDGAVFVVFAILTVATLAIPNLASWIKIACGMVALYSGIRWWREMQRATSG
jgi:hypothetical protein